MIRALVITATVIVITGCATTELSSKARSVRLVSNAPENLLRDYTEVKTVSSYYGANFRRPAGNIVQCQNDLRNQAAEAGANLVVITSQQIGNVGCPNCISLVGTAYRQKSP